MVDCFELLEGVYVPSGAEEEIVRLPNTSGISYNLMNATSSNYKVLSHVLLSSNKQNCPIEGDVKSNLYNVYKDLFLTICKKNNIQVNTIFRAAINLTYHYKEIYGEIHTDHGFDHKNFIYCLNNFGSGNTYLFNDNMKLVNEIKQFKNKFTFFPGCAHAQGFCLPGEHRIILIFTFI